jgi:large subunit ribosomal protein L5
MHFLNYFYQKTLKFDSINKFHYTNLKKLPKLRKITLNFNCQTTELKKLATHLLALELITKQKGKLIGSTRPNITLKVRKGDPIGCSLTLKKQLTWNFLFKSFIEIFPKIKSFEGIVNIKKIKKTTVSFVIKNNLNFSELTEHYSLFNSLSKLNVSIIVDANNEKEMIFFMNSLRLTSKNNL